MEPKVNNTVAPVVESTPDATQDIVARVAKVDVVDPTVIPTVEAPQQTLEQRISSLEGDVSKPLMTQEEINSIPDPKLREYIQAKEKDMVKGMNEKFRNIAELKKELEQSKSQSQVSDRWTKDRLQQELQNPEFSQAVQDYASQSAPQDWVGTQEEWSNLNTNEKREFNIMKSELKGLKDSQRQFQLQQTDQTIKGKFEDYSPEQVNDFEAKLRRGVIDDSTRREFIYKALNYEKHVNRAYNLKIQDESGKVQAKVNASTIDSTQSQTPAIDLPKREENEKTSNYFVKLARRNMEQLKLKQGG